MEIEDVGHAEAVINGGGEGGQDRAKVLSHEFIFYNISLVNKNKTSL